jgi:hypothetical protein
MENEFIYINGYENLYKINKLGEIFSCIYQKNMIPQLCKQQNYFKVSLTKEGKRIKQSIHRLLALQYIDNPDNLPEVDHIDCNRTNNCISNLRWVSRIENQNNKKSNLSNLTEEEKEIKKQEMKDYKAKWAREHYVKKEKKVLTEEEIELKKQKMKEYKAKWIREKRARV